MGEVGHPFTTKQIGRAYDAGRTRFGYVTDEVIFDWSADLSDIAKHCRDPEAIAKACGFASATNEKDKRKAERAVYVIGVDGLPVSKIGVSRCPAARHFDLKGAHWADLVLHAIIWFPTRKADTVEQSALKAATEMECRLNGEWVAMEPEEAFELVLKAARFHRVPACDSATWLQNWNRRVDALAETKRREAEFWRAAKAA